MNKKLLIDNNITLILLQQTTTGIIKFFSTFIENLNVCQNNAIL